MARPLAGACVSACEGGPRALERQPGTAGGAGGRAERRARGHRRTPRRDRPRGREVGRTGRGLRRRVAGIRGDSCGTRRAGPHLKPKRGQRNMEPIVAKREELAAKTKQLGEIFAEAKGEDGKLHWKKVKSVDGGVDAVQAEVERRGKELSELKGELDVL